MNQKSLEAIYKRAKEYAKTESEALIKLHLRILTYFNYKMPNLLQEQDFQKFRNRNWFQILTQNQ